MYTTSLCFALLLHCAFQKEEENSRLDLRRRWRGGIWEEERDGRTESHQHHRVASPIKRSWWRHTPWKRLNVIFSPPKKGQQLAPLFLTFFFFLTHRSNSKRLTGTPTSQPSGKIKSTRNLFREGSWSIQILFFFSDIRTPKIELRSVAFPLFVYNVTGSLRFALGWISNGPRSLFSLMIEDTWEK